MIRLVSFEEATQDLASLGIGAHPKNPESLHFGFLGGGGECRYWTYPERAGAVPHFVDALIRALPPSDRFWLLPPRGYWRRGKGPPAWPVMLVWDALLAGLGVPLENQGALVVDAKQGKQLEALLFLQIALGPSVILDTLMVPRDGRFILYFEHHHVVHATFREQSDLDAAAAALESSGYPLPAEAPDATFKPVSWMVRKPCDEDPPGA